MLKITNNTKVRGVRGTYNDQRMLPASLSWGPTLGSKNTFLPRKFENPCLHRAYFSTKPIHEAYTFHTTKHQQPGDSKWPFDSLVGGHLTFPNGHLTIPKRAPAELPTMGFSLFGLIYFIDFGGSTKWHPGNQFFTPQGQPTQHPNEPRHPNAEIGFLTNQGISIFKTIAEAR